MAFNSSYVMPLLKGATFGLLVSALFLGPVVFFKHKENAKFDRLPAVTVTQLSNGAALHRTIDKDLNRVCYIVFAANEQLPQQVAITCEDI